MRLFKFIKPFRLMSGAIALLLICSLISLSARSALSSSLRLQSTSTQLEPAAEIAQTPDLGQAFQELRIEGAIVIYDKNNQRFYEHNPSRNTTAFFPASTFKILNALISLETGVIRDDVSVLTWDGITREIPVWNHDTNLRQAFKDSTVWFYQVLARKNGHERMQQFVEQVDYGNQQIGTPDRIDHFWLDGPLQITPKQEIEFLQRLEQNDLPFSQRTIDLVKDIMIIEKTPDYTLRGKTGWINSADPNIGWIVGYLEQKNNVYLFATNIVISDSQDAAKRLEVTRRSFQALGLL
jgi:beta-lactamase class D